jgi:hypothetical protein
VRAALTGNDGTRPPLTAAQIAATAAAFSTSAFAGPKFSIIGMGVSAKNTITDATVGPIALDITSKGKLAYGGGLLMEFPR